MENILKQLIAEKQKYIDDFSDSDYLEGYYYMGAIDTYVKCIKIIEDNKIGGRIS